jgi:pimeloyl-ACP methyl ester carboxylesterase
VRAETLLVWGERDPLVPPSVGELFRSELQKARLEVLRGARHVPMVERPREFAALLAEFLA